MFKKHIHYNPEIESATLGSFLIEPSAFGRCYGILSKEVFYTEENQVVYELIEKMWENNEKIDVLTVVNKYCRTFKTTELGGYNAPFYITRLTNPVVSTANLESHALILKQMYIERELMRITMSGIEQGKDVLIAVGELEDKLREITRISVKDDFKDIDETLLSLYQHMDHVKDKEVVGVTTGFQQLDTITGGLLPGGMYVVAARPSVGKTAFMGKMAIGAARKGVKVGIISLEMDNNRMTARLASLTTEVEFWRIYRNRMVDDSQRDFFYEKIAKELSRLPIKISDTASVTIGDIKAKVARLIQKKQLEVLFVDYLGLIDTGGTNRNYNREQEVSKMSRGIKMLAMQYQIPIILLCQLNRMSEQSGDKKPKLHHLRESGSIEQDADGVIFIHRDYMSGIKVNSEGQSTENEADLIVAKWRDGEVCEYKIGFDGGRMRFYEQNSNMRPLPNNFYESNEEPPF